MTILKVIILEDQLCENRHEVDLQLARSHLFSERQSALVAIVVANGRSKSKRGKNLLVLVGLWLI